MSKLLRVLADRDLCSLIANPTEVEDHDFFSIHSRHHLSSASPCVSPNNLEAMAQASSQQHHPSNFKTATRVFHVDRLKPPTRTAVVRQLLSGVWH
jgi:hypothetical protein